MQSRSLVTCNVPSQRLLKLYIPRSVHTYILCEKRKKTMTRREQIVKKNRSHCNDIREHRKERTDLLVDKYQPSDLAYSPSVSLSSLGLLLFALIHAPNKQLVPDDV